MSNLVRKGLRNPLLDVAVQAAAQKPDAEHGGENGARRNRLHEQVRCKPVLSVRRRRFPFPRRLSRQRPRAFRRRAAGRDGARPCGLFLGVRSRSILFIHIPPAPVYCPGRANMSDSRIIQKHVRTDGRPARTGRGPPAEGWEAGRPRGRKAGPAGCAVKANRIAALRRRQTGKPGRAQEPKPGRRWPKNGPATRGRGSSAGRRGNIKNAA